MLQSYPLESLDIINPLNFKFQRIFSPPAPRLAVQCVSVSVHWVEINFSTNLVIARQSFFICVEDKLHRSGTIYRRQVRCLGKLRPCSPAATPAYCSISGTAATPVGTEHLVHGQITDSPDQRQLKVGIFHSICEIQIAEYCTSRPVTARESPHRDVKHDNLRKLLTTSSECLL